MTLPAPRLLRRTQLCPGESLASIIERLTLLNGYESSRTILELCKIGTDKSLILPRSPDWLLRLSALADVMCGDLYAAAGNIYTGILPQPEFRGASAALGSTGMSSRSARKYFWYTNAAKFCPMCLREAAYHRLLWTLNCVSVCTQHQLLLTDICPMCRGRVSIRDVVLAECNTCRADLTKAESKQIGQNTFGMISQQIIHSWFTGGSVSEQDLPWPLPHQPPAVLFQFLCDLLQWMRKMGLPAAAYEISRLHDTEALDDSLTRGLSTTDNRWIEHQTWTAAFTGIANWPKGFHELLAAWPHKPTGRSYRRAFTDRLQEVFEGDITSHWKGPSYTFVKYAFFDYIAVRDGFSPDDKHMHANLRRSCMTRRGKGKRHHSSS